MICGYVNGGLSLELTAKAVGIAPQSITNWLAKGRRDDAEEPYASFAVDVDRAAAMYATALQQRVNKASEQDWKAAAWILERRFREDYARAPHPETIEVQQTLSVLVETTGLPISTIRRAMESGAIPEEAIGRHPSGRRFIADTKLAHRALMGTDPPPIDAHGEDTTVKRPSPVAQIEAARLARQEALADKARLDVEERRGELVRKDDVQRELTATLHVFRDALLQVPARLAPELAHLADTHSVQQSLDIELRRVLDDLVTKLHAGGAEADVSAV